MQNLTPFQIIIRILVVVLICYVVMCSYESDMKRRAFEKKLDKDADDYFSTIDFPSLFQAQCH